ncbi:rubrerythrin [Desulfitispora alkaliphila]|uniref:ferritin family protein n=1 Tax=Desulfitispora alkaliphila TaxID=622674 RepID=UPI003D248EB0
MNRKQILNSLNWFLLLEKQQVELYGSQSKSTDDPYLRRYLDRFAEIEQEHVNTITKIIKSFDSKPKPYVEYSGFFLGEFVRLGGQAIAGHTDVKNYLRINMLGERMAIRDYKKFIRSVNDPTIKDALWKHLIDEELHLQWMQHRVRELTTRT